MARCAAVDSAGLVGLALTTSGASAQQQPELPQGWFKACSQQEETNICNVQNIIMAETGTDCLRIAFTGWP